MLVCIVACKRWHHVLTVPCLRSICRTELSDHLIHICIYTNTTATHLSLSHWHPQVHSVAQHGTHLRWTAVSRRSTNNTKQRLTVPLKAAHLIVRPQRLSKQRGQTVAKFLKILLKHFLVLMLILGNEPAVDLQRCVANLDKLSVKTQDKNYGMGSFIH